MSTPYMRSCPKLYLAPMEGVGTWFFRKAFARIGGFDECSTEFIRVPSNGLCKSLAKAYPVGCTFPIPQAAQIMGSDPALLAEMTFYLTERNAPRIDLNCGCPSNTVTGKNAGSGLLQTPDKIYTILKAMRQATSVPVTAKVRSGFLDTSLLKENLLAVQEAGASFITIHPRTKVQGYTGQADWSVIKMAKELLHIPVVGNGDILSAEDAHRMLSFTNCDALMIGRGALKNPWIFHEIKRSFGVESRPFCLDELKAYIAYFVELIPDHASERGKVALLKQLFGYLFWTDELFETVRKQMLRTEYQDCSDFLALNLPFLKTRFVENGGD